MSKPKINRLHPTASRRQYTDAERAEALIKLAVNKHDIRKTAKELGIPYTTLRYWAKHGTKKGVFPLLERAIERMLMVIPDKWKGNDWAIALGILIDKYQLLQGEPTSRSENVFRHLQELTDEEREAVVEQARSIVGRISDAGAGGASG